MMDTASDVLKIQPRRIALLAGSSKELPQQVGAVFAHLQRGVVVGVEEEAFLCVGHQLRRGADTVQRRLEHAVLLRLNGRLLEQAVEQRRVGGHEGGHRLEHLLQLVARLLVGVMKYGAELGMVAW